MTMSPFCPPTTAWEQSLQDAFADALPMELRAHLDGCTACQKVVEGLIDRDDASRRLVATLREELPETSPICEQTVQRLKEAGPQSQ